MSAELVTILSAEDTPYHRIENIEDDNIQNIASNDIITDKFKFLDNFMLYLPLFVSKLPSGTSRSKIYKVFVAICVFMWLLTRIGFCIVFFFNNSHVDIHILVPMVAIQIFAIIMRILSFIYYYYHFNYPWYTERKYLEKYTHQTKRKSGCTVRNYRLIIQIFLITLCVLYPISSVAGMLYWNTANYKSLIFGIIFNLITNFFDIVAVFLTAIIQAVICYKYYCHITKLMDDYQNISSYDLLLRYQKMFSAFKKDYNIFLKWTVICYLISWLINLWYGMNDDRVKHNMYNDNTIEGGSYYIMAFGSWVEMLSYITMYIISACILSERFAKFQDLLWKKQTELIQKGNQSETIHTLSSTIMFTCKYPIYINVGSLVMTRKNIIIFMASFLAARIFSLLK
eukprot:419242_1